MAQRGQDNGLSVPAGVLERDTRARITFVHLRSPFPPLFPFGVCLQHKADEAPSSSARLALASGADTLKRWTKGSGHTAASGRPRLLPGPLTEPALASASGLNAVGRRVAAKGTSATRPRGRRQVSPPGPPLAPAQLASSSPEALPSPGRRLGPRGSPALRPPAPAAQGRVGPAPPRARPGRAAARTLFPETPPGPWQPPRLAGGLQGRAGRPRRRMKQVEAAAGGAVRDGGRRRWRFPRSLPADGLPAAGAGGRHRGCVPRLRERGGAGAAESKDQVTARAAERERARARPRRGGLSVAGARLR